MLKSMSKARDSGTIGELGRFSVKLVEPVGRLPFLARFFGGSRRLVLLRKTAYLCQQTLIHIAIDAFVSPLYSQIEFFLPKP